MNDRTNSASPGLVAIAAPQNEVHSGRFAMTLHEESRAGHAASASSVFHPGSFDHFTGSKRAVGATGIAGFFVTQPDNATRARQATRCSARGVKVRSVPF